MSPEQWQRVSRALDELLGLAETERDRFLEQLRSDDPQLCDEVESLAKQQESTDLFDSPPARLLTLVQSSALSAIQVPERAGRFQLRDVIAHGGMGAVVRAYDPDIQRTLAVKLLLPATRGIAEMQWRFVRETRIAGRLQHPGIPPIHEMGRLDDGSPFFAMKLIEGQTLASLLRQPTRPSLAQLIGIFEQICRTLAFVHGQRIIHRDLKPSNVMVGAFGEVQVMDWGLAKELAQHDAPEHDDRPNDSPECTTAGAVSGTPAYMAPEQARGETDQLDERCDVFGLGGILCVMLAGRPPFVGESSDMIRASSVGDLQPAYEKLDSSGADPELLSIAKRCLAADASQRYGDAGEVADAITRYRDGIAEKLRQAEIVRERAEAKAGEERRRRRLLAVLAAVVIATVMAGAGAAMWRQAERANIEQERIRREAEKASQKKYLEKEIAASLDRAESIEQDLHARLADPRRVSVLLSKLDEWKSLLDRSAAALDQAAALSGGAAATLDVDVMQRIEKLRAKAASDRADYQWTIELDDVRSAAAMRSSPAELDFGRLAEAANLAYRKSFENRKLDLANGDPAEIARTVSSMPSRLVVASALDEWAVAAFIAKDMALAGKLSSVTRKVDPDTWRDTIRDTANWRKDQFAPLLRNADPAQLSPQFLSMAGQLLFHVEGSAANFMREAVAQHPNDFWLQFNTGWFHQNRPSVGEQGWLREMTSSYQAALAIRPNSKGTHLILSWVLDSAGDRAGAAAHYRRAMFLDPHHPLSLALNPRDAASHLSLGFKFQEMRHWAAAVSHFRRAAELDPKLASAHSNYGKILVDARDFQKAIAPLEKAIALEPNNAAAHTNLGVALNETKQIDRALICHRRAAEINPTNSMAHNNIGTILHGKKDLEGALACYRKAHELDSNNHHALLNIGLIHLQRGEIAESHRAYQQALAQSGKTSNFPAFVAVRVQELRRPGELDARLSEVLADAEKPIHPHDLVEMAEMCVQFKKAPSTAVILYRRAFSQDAKLAAKHCVAASAAALSAAASATEHGKTHSAKERADYRGQALDWLTSQRTHLAKARNEPARKELAAWQQHPELASVRGPQALASLPQDEREAWQSFWVQVAEIAKAPSPR